MATSQRTTGRNATKPAEDPDDFEAFDDGGDDISVATGSSYPKMEDLEGCLLLMRPYDEGTRPSTTPNAKPGDTYAWVECDVVVLQSPDAGEDDMPTDFFEGEAVPFELEGFQFTGQQVTSFLKQKMRRGKRGLGILVKGEKSRRGGSAPWILEAPSEDQFKLAVRYSREVRAAKTQGGKADIWE
jgi:hypothetical protein